MKLFISNFKNIDSSIKNVCKNGLKFCFALILIATLILTTYLSIHNPNLFYLGISIFRSSLFFMAFFIICAIAIDTIKKDLIWNIKILATNKPILVANLCSCNAIASMRNSLLS